MSAGRVYHRVYARFRGRVALVNSFPNAQLADPLTRRLAGRYGSQGATFWHTAEDTETGATWGALRNRLRAAEPLRLSQDAADRLASEAGRQLREIPVGDGEIEQFLAAGGAITVLAPGRAKHRSLKSTRRRP